ncbi:MAG TPA: cation acetate symporter [Myxococcota bacterium]|nr:cation acetate symporter [Myxococcota bacterium]HQK50381.1 cation acetate symporter [Myxococcota bacterium]
MDWMPIIIFLAFVASVLGLSFFFARRTRSAAGYYAAGGTIHWSVNGIAFAGDYLSAASFLGICGMIATAGYDGFLYSIGYLAGWIVAMFVVAEPMKRLGRYTFTDALDSRFNSKGIQLAAGISTLIVSIFYLIPQMVGAGVLITPLLGLPHAVGVVLVGTIVIIIVATAGMTSTTYVQFLKGGLLVVFSLVVVIAVLFRGLSTEPDQGGRVPFHKYATLDASETEGRMAIQEPGWEVAGTAEAGGTTYVKAVKDGRTWWFKKVVEDGAVRLQECQYEAETPSGRVVNGEAGGTLRQAGNLVSIDGSTDPTGPLGPAEFLARMSSPKTRVQLFKQAKFQAGDDKVIAYCPTIASGNKLLKPGQKFKVEGTPLQKLDFVSLMLALFLGTAALPHILIRYYTVPSPAAARKSTIVAIAAIGFFYVLTLYMGLGAMVNAVVNPADNNMSAPLLARSFGGLLFAVISAIAFATVLGTVSGLIVAASGAVAHDLMDRFGGMHLSDKAKVKAGKIAAIVVGIFAMILGIVFHGINVTFLVGLAFAVAASANLPAIVMMLFWKKTTAKGIVASILVGIGTAVGIILFSPTLWTLYGLKGADAPIPFENPGLFSIPASFVTLVIVSLLTQPRNRTE